MAARRTHGQTPHAHGGHPYLSRNKIADYVYMLALKPQCITEQLGGAPMQ